MTKPDVNVPRGMNQHLVFWMLQLQLYTVCPKRLGHILKPNISKTRIHDGKEFQTYLKGESSGYYFDIKFTFFFFFCDGNLGLHVKEIIPTKPHYHTEKKDIR